MRGLAGAMCPIRSSGRFYEKPAFLGRGAEVQVPVHTSRLSCKRAEKARIYSCRLGIHLETPGLIFGQLSSRMSGHEVVPYDA
jgi:hypothetical protein